MLWRAAADGPESAANTAAAFALPFRLTMASRAASMWMYQPGIRHRLQDAATLMRHPFVMRSAPTRDYKNESGKLVGYEVPKYSGRQYRKFLQSRSGNAKPLT